MYLALYRKYRPVNFSDIIGQEHITRTLVNQINNNKIGHAYLFCGSRGTGKTTAAKIFAKAVNCQKPVNGSPCGSCATCKSLSDISNLDILEIDAASNNGIDEIRELKEKIKYLPVNGKYKVYIIDEVHMLSSSAFNALLKTLEEPPEFVIFVLATTEVHKLPPTILSRCMRFDFKLVPEQKIAALIAKIYKECKKESEPEALAAIARAGEGSVRDALSIADICLSYSNGKLTYNDVMEVLGSTDKDSIFLLAENILSANSSKVLELCDSLLSFGKGIGVLNKDIINCLRDICVIKLSKNAYKLLKYPQDIYDRIEKISKLCSYEKVLKCIEILSLLESELRYTAAPRIIFETYLLKCSKTESETDAEALSIRIAELENKINNGFISSMPPKSETNKQEPGAKKQEKTSPKSAIVSEEIVKPEIKEDNISADKAVLGGQAAAGKVWGSVIKTLRQNKNGMLYSICSEMRCEISGKNLTIISDGKQAADIIKKEANFKIIKDIIDSVGEYNIFIKYNEEKEQDFSDLKNLIGNKLIIE